MYEVPRLEQDEKIVPTGYTANGEGMLRYEYQVGSTTTGAQGGHLSGR